MARGLLQRLEQSVECLLGQHVDFVDHVYLVARLAGRESHPLAQLPDLIDAAIRCRVDLDQVQTGPRSHTPADVALVARRIIHVTDAIDGLGKNTGRRGLARSTQPGEQVSMPNAPCADLVAQCSRNVLLPENILERLAAPFVIQCRCRHGATTRPSSAHNAAGKTQFGIAPSTTLHRLGLERSTEWLAIRAACRLHTVADQPPSRSRLRRRA